MPTCESLHYVLLLLVLLLLLKIFSRLTLGVSKSNTCLVGKTVLITGANSGMGYQTALVLAGRGARIIIADKDDATESMKNIADETGNKNLVYKHLDLSSLASIRRFAEEIKKEEDRLDILINNAGVSGSDEVYTEDGLLLAMQINHYGPFLLTHLLTDLLRKSAPSRIIFVSSLLAFVNNLTLENMNMKPKFTFEVFSEVCLYGNTKLMNIVTANMFAEKLRESKVTVNSLHPGVVETPIFLNIGGPNAFRLGKFMIYKIWLPLCGKSPLEGAQTQIECALSKELENVTGKYFVDCREFPQPRKASNKDFCMKLWKKSEDLVHLSEEERLM